MSIYDDVRHHHANLDGLWRAKIAKAATSVDEPVYVTITAFDKKLRWGPCKWVTRGANFPQRGQDCLVSFDETQKRPYVIAWWDGTMGGSGPEGADAHYVHTQSILSATWTVTHNLGKLPAVEVVDSGDSVIIPDVEYIDLNQVVLNFGSPTSGKAVFN